MGRWQPDARERLEQAALELFTEQGFAETTVPQITARAGLTTRTFFRHFADKREVLFAGDEQMPALVAQFLAEAPAGLSPMALIAQGLEAMAAARFEGRLDELRVRRAIVLTDDSLQERELRKMSVLSAAISKGFRERGLDETSAALAAQLAGTTFSVSIGRWLGQDGDRSLTEFVRDTVATMRSLVGT